MSEEKFPIGTPVEKTGGEYQFSGIVVSVFKKINGSIRYVVEDDRGLLFIFNQNNLKNRNA